MKKYIITIATILLLVLCSCGASEEETETEVTPQTYEFQDISFELDSSWNFRTLEEMQSTGIEMYDTLSRSDWDGFIDERVLITEESMPVFVYCFSLVNESITIDDILQYADETGELEAYNAEEVDINGIRGISTIDTENDEDGTYYYYETTFILNSKAYMVFTMGSDDLPGDVYIDKILSSIHINE